VAFNSDWSDYIDNVIDLKTAAPQPVTNGHHPEPDHPLVKAALERRLTDLATTSAGSRNDALNQAAAYLGRFPIDRADLRDMLLDACHANGSLSDDGQRQCDATIRSGFKKADLDGPRVIEDRTINGHVTEVGAATINGVRVDLPDQHPIWGSHTPNNAAAFLFDHDDTAVALWGNDEHILWAEGEALMIAGGMGLGKTTLAGQIIRAQLGLDTTVLGLPVTAATGPILYLAMDRPRQIRRSMQRQFDETERDQLANLLIRPGPPVADIAARPTLLAEMAQEAGAAVLYVDSLKDAAIGLSSDEVGAAYNRARQYALANNVQICELHHLIKRNPMGGQPSHVADVYGSNWLTAGAGSVVMLTGEPGDPIVEFRHAKQPFSEVGPFRLMNDQIRGLFTIDHEVDLLALAAVAGPNGLTPQGAAAAIFEKDKPTRAQVEKARRRLDKLAGSGQLTRVEGMKGGADGGVSANYFLVR
jgi:hypothetical protein